MKSIPKLSAWSLSQEALQWIAENIDPGDVLEFGSGAGTQALADLGYKMVSVEHDPRFIGKHQSEYLHVPIRDGWYDLATLKKLLPKREWHLILIGGSPGNIGRGAFANHYEALGLAAIPLLIDDTNREPEKRLTQQLNKDNLYAEHSIIASDGREACSLLPQRIPGHPGSAVVESDLAGGLGNRLCHLINAETAARLYGIKALHRWHLTRHCSARFEELFDNPEINIQAVKHERYPPLSHGHIGPGGGLVFGHHWFLLPRICGRYRYKAREVAQSLRPSARVRDKVIDLAGKIDAYSLRQYHPGSVRYEGKLPPGSFLATDCRLTQQKNPQCISPQTSLGESDLGEHRNIPGMVEAAADWFTLCTARKIYYNFEASSFHMIQRKLLKVPSQHVANVNPPAPPVFTTNKALHPRDP